MISPSPIFYDINGNALCGRLEGESVPLLFAVSLCGNADCGLTGDGKAER